MAKNWYKVSQDYDDSILRHHDFVGFHCQKRERDEVYDGIIPFSEEYAEAYYYEILDALPFSIRDKAMHEGLMEDVPEKYSDEFREWASRVHDFLRENNIRWIFVSETKPLSEQYGDYCYYVLLPEDKYFGLITDTGVNDFATVYLYEADIGSPTCIPIEEV